MSTFKYTPNSTPSNSLVKLYFDTLETNYERYAMVNGFKKDILTEKNFLLRLNHLEMYVGLTDKKFSKVFQAISTTKNAEPYYYPIVITLSNIVDDGFHEIEIPAQILADINSNNCKILILGTYEGWGWDFFWNRLSKIICKKFHLQNHHIIFMCGNYLKNSTHKNIVLNTWEFLQDYNHSIMKNGPSLIELIKQKKNRRHRFICLNRRPTAVRFAITSLLYPYRNLGILTCAQYAGYGPPLLNLVTEEFKQKFTAEYEYFKLNVQSQMPILFAEDEYNPEVDNPAGDFNAKKFLDSYLYVVTETYFEHDTDKMFFSEKIFKPIIFMMPFVLIAQPFSLAYLKNIGYKSFHPHIDESYDLETNDQRRLKLVFKEIKKIISMSADELNDFLVCLLPILEHNKNHLQNRCDSIVIDNLKKDLITCLIDNSERDSL